MSTVPAFPSAPSPTWLEEWQQHQEWQQDLDEELAATTPARRGGLRLLPSFPEPAAPAKGTASQTPVQAGQVRVLAPLPITGAQEPRAVLVLQASVENPGRWTCAPFSPLSAPAHEGEWRCATLEARDPRLGVLCLWDSAEVEGPLLASTRLLASPGQELLNDALAVWTAWKDGAALPGHLAAQVGPRVVSLLDPRHEYEAETGGALQPWAELCSYSIRRPSAVQAKSAYSAAADSTLALAASPAEDMQLERCFTLGDTGLRLSIRPLNPLEATLRIKEPTGQLSHTLDGGRLVLADGSSVPVSAEFRASLSRLAQGFTIADPTGAVLPVRI